MIECCEASQRLLCEQCFAMRPPPVLVMRAVPSNDVQRCTALNPARDVCWDFALQTTLHMALPNMEAEERPAKLRKLEHAALNAESAMVEHQVSDELRHQRVNVDVHGEEAGHLQSTGADFTDTNEPDANDSESSMSEDHAGLEPPGQQSTSGPPLSKNALKKIRNKERWDAGRDARKLKRKQKIAEKRMRKRAAKEEARAAAMAKAAKEEANRKGKTTINLQGARLVQEIFLQANGWVDKPTHTSHTRLPITFVIDCGFDNLMTEREMISLGSQLTRSYSDNHKATYQAHMFVSSWGGQLKDRFDSVLEKHHENWRGVTFIEEDFVEAAERAKPLMRGETGGKLAGAFATKTDGGISTPKGSQLVPQGAADKNEAVTDGRCSAQQPQSGAMAVEEEERLMVEKLAPLGKENAAISENGVAMDTEISNHGPLQHPKPQAPEVEAQHDGEIVYLTSDSPHTLDRLHPYSTYIVGGLVDKNRHKGLCYKTACARGIKTAKLPIGEFMEMQSRFVLATNHVVEIMVRWLECGDWGESFMRVVPKRKGGVLKAAHGIKQDMHGFELEVEDSNPGAGDSRAPKTHVQGGDVLENGQNLPSMIHES